METSLWESLRAWAVLVRYTAIFVCPLNLTPCHPEKYKRKDLPPPHSPFSRPVPAKSDLSRGGYLPQSPQQPGPHQGYSKSQAQYSARPAEGPTRVQSTPPTESLTQSRYSRGTATSSSYHPDKTGELPYAPFPGAPSNLQYSGPPQYATPPTTPPNPQYSGPPQYASPPAARPAAQYPWSPPNQLSSSSKAASYLPFDKDGGPPGRPQYIMPDPNTNMGTQQVTIPSIG